MNGFEQIWDGISKSIANAVNANIGSQLANSARSFHAATSHGASRQVYPKSQVRQPQEDPAMAAIHAMFQRIMEKIQQHHAIPPLERMAAMMTHQPTVRTPRAPQQATDERKKPKEEPRDAPQQKKQPIPSPFRELDRTPDKKVKPASFMESASQWFNKLVGGDPNRFRNARTEIDTATQNRKDLKAAVAKRNELGSKIGATEYNEPEHRKAIKAVKDIEARIGKDAISSQGKLTESTKGGAKAVLTQANASMRVAEALKNLGGFLGKLGMFGSIASAAAAIARSPWTLKNMGASRLAYLESQGEHEGRGAALAAAKYARVSGNIEALNSRDTAASTNFMVDQMNKLRYTLRPIENAGTNALNYGLGAVMRLASEDLKLRMLPFQFATWELSRFFQGKGIGGIEEFQKERKEKEEKDAKVFNKVGSNVAKTMVDQMQKQRDEARKNNRVQKPIPPIRLK